MTRRRHLVLLGLGLGATLAGGALCAGPPSAPARKDAAGPDLDEAAQFLFSLSLNDADGRRRALAHWRGKLLIVNFWATWCTPCVEEMPELQRAADAYRGSNVAVLGIGVDDAEPIRQFRRKHALRLDLLVTGFEGMDLAQRMGNPEAVLPYTVVISPAGRIVERHSGRLENGQLGRWVAAHRSL